MQGFESELCEGPCEAGHFCVAGSIAKEGRTANNGTDQLCAVGYFCPPGSTDAQGSTKNEPDPKPCKEAG